MGLLPFVRGAAIAAILCERFVGNSDFVLGILATQI